MSARLEVLLVEDNPGDANLIQEIMSAAAVTKFHFTHVARLSKAIRHLKEKSAELALLDLGLPDSSGLETLRSIRRAVPWIPIVVLTGAGSQSAAEQLVLLLQTQAHVTVIGDTTAGFANPSEVYQLTGNWTLDIPEMVTYTTDTVLVFGIGVPPDVHVPVTEADFASGIDPLLDTALEMLTQDIIPR